jgi:hypothetical protein
MMAPPNIITRHDPKPGPLRQFDWEAQYKDANGDDPCGYGTTEEEAIADLKETFPRDHWDDWE